MTPETIREIFATPKLDEVPAPMREAQRWIPCSIQRGEDGRLKKTPAVRCWRDPAQLYHLEEILAARTPPPPVEFVLGDDWWGIDFDKCRDKDTGAIRPDIMAVIRAFDSFSDISPSGTGVHVYGRGGPMLGAWTASLGGDCKVEAYFGSPRLFVFTGKKLDGCPAELSGDATIGVLALRGLVAQFASEPKKKQRKQRGQRDTDLPLAVEALKHLSPERAIDRKFWIDVGMVMHDVDDSDESFAAWDEWSKQAPNYGGTEEAWASFGKRERASGEKLTIGSLLRWAHEYDPSWRPPPPPQGDVFGDGLSYDELSVGIRLARMHCEVLKYVEDAKVWAWFDGKRWVMDAIVNAEALAKEVIYWMEARVVEHGATVNRDNENDDEEYKMLKRSVRALRCARSIKGIVYVAHSEAAALVKSDRFDRDSLLINWRNGTLDLRIKPLRLRPHDPKDMLTKMAGCEIADEPYSPERAPACERAFGNVFRKVPGLWRFMKILSAYIMSGTMREKVVVICYGEGDNGKSTYWDVELAMFGEYGRMMRRDFVSASGSRGGRDREEAYDTASLQGVRLALVEEPPDGQRLNESLIKYLTNKLMSGRNPYQKGVEFDATSTLVINTNNKPDIAIGGQALFTRLLMIPCDQEFAKPHELVERQAVDPSVLSQEPDTEDATMAELRWHARDVMEHWQAYLEERLDPPQGVKDAAREYAATSDIVKRWHDEEIVPRENHFLSNRDCRVSFADWYRRTGGEGKIPMSPKMMTMKMQNFGHESTTNGDLRGFRGVALRHSIESTGPY